MMKTSSRMELVKEKKARQEEDEWVGMIKRQHQLNEDMANYEKEIGQMKMKAFRQDLLTQCQLKRQEQKDDELEQRAAQQQDMAIKRKEHEWIERKAAAKRDQDRESLQREYGEMTSQNTHQKQQNKEARLSYEQALLQENQRQLKLEQQRQYQVRQQNKQRAQEYTRIEQQKREEQLRQKSESIREHQQLIQQNIQKVAAKEKQYRQFFDRQDQVLASKQNLYFQRVKTEQNERDLQLSLLVDKNIKEEHAKFGRYLQGVEDKREQMQDSIRRHQTEVMLMRSQEKARHSDLKRQQQQERLQTEGAVQQEESQHKQGVNYQKKLYSQVLHEQAHSRLQQQRQQEWAMHKVERIVDRVGRVPGCQPQLGGVPMKNLQQIMLTNSPVPSALQTSLPYLKGAPPKERIGGVPAQTLSRSQIAQHKEKHQGHTRRLPYHRKGDQYRESSMAGIF